MNAEILVNRVLDDEGLAGDLGEKAAEALVGWTVKQAEKIAASAANEKAGQKQLEGVCRKARAIGRLVTTLCQKKDSTGAAAIAKQEGLPWPVADATAEEKAVAWLLSRD